MIEVLVNNPLNVKRIVCITFCGRSGSYLLSNLLDGHPETLSLPVHSAHHLTDSISSWLDSLARREPKLDEFLQFVFKKIPYLRQEADHPPTMSGIAKNTELGVKWSKLKRSLELVWVSLVRLRRVDLEGIFKAIHVAYSHAKNIEVTTDKPVIVWQKHMPFNKDKQWEKVAKALGHITCLIAVRNPAKSIDSHIYHHWVESPWPPFYNLPKKLTRHFCTSAENFPKSSQNCRIYAVRFEDVHINTENIMKRLAELLELSWDPILLETTEDRKPIYFFKTGNAVTGVSKSRGQDVNFKLFSSWDVCKVEMLFQDHYKAWGYSFRHFDSTKSIAQYVIYFFIPSKLEVMGFLEQFSCTIKYIFRISNERQLLIFDSGIKGFFRMAVLSLLSPVIFVYEHIIFAVWGLKRIRGTNISLPPLLKPNDE